MPTLSNGLSHMALFALFILWPVWPEVAALRQSEDAQRTSPTKTKSPASAPALGGGLRHFHLQHHLPGFSFLSH